ncbi:hypothetical protein EUU23_03110 [Sphingorhabdus sp. IMCC26285]|uniref:Uncharacterized protein n=1 Tax=Sphingorhabdus profundilacus TaxID=2509718 RepID=A0A6I4LXX2_9SPHN|nr:hypothetical protein [Sphingorhabdus profundilacus]MVZ96694.1 hypothetical protein [Sphingorhabdus profundilacus]
MMSPAFRRHAELVSASYFATWHETKTLKQVQGDVVINDRLEISSALRCHAELVSASYFATWQETKTLKQVQGDVLMCDWLDLQIDAVR